MKNRQSTLKIPPQPRCNDPVKSRGFPGLKSSKLLRNFLGDSASKTRLRFFLREKRPPQPFAFATPRLRRDCATQGFATLRQNTTRRQAWGSASPRPERRDSAALRKPRLRNASRCAPTPRPAKRDSVALRFDVMLRKLSYVNTRGYGKQV
jgi:hypothetical protein